MAFLDNSGDIILDAVLTDAGRKRLARGDGTFKVTKYAFGDDEIDYGSYNATHASGTAYFDLEILQTPVLEAFTNNRSSLKSRLISLTNNNLLYLPEMLLNEVENETSRTPNSALSSGSFLVFCTATALDNIEASTNTTTDLVDVKQKYMNGNSISNNTYRHIRIDQGLNTDKLDASKRLSPELTEQQYMIQIDNRLGSIVDDELEVQGSPSFIDDDQIATYYITQNVGKYVDFCKQGSLTGTPNVGIGHGGELLEGPRGTKLRFAIHASSNLKASSYLFDTLGTTGITDSTNTYSVINTTVKVTGITTGYSIDVPITFVRETT
jgi:hypothetical protein